MPRFDPAEQAATVVAAHGRLFYLEAANGEHRIAVTRGKRNDYTVGDQVIARATSADQHVIEKLVPRRNEMLRSDAWRSKRLAANLDQIGIVISGSPPFSEELLVRVLITAEIQRIAATIVANKSDLHDAHAAIEPRLRYYESIGYPVLRVAAKSAPEQTLSLLRPWLSGRTTLLLGQSGMGKSTLINLLVPDAGLATQEISDALQTGRHTTTFSRLFSIGGGTMAEPPADAMPAHAMPAHAMPAHAMPANAMPADATSSDAILSDTVAGGVGGRIIDSPGFQTFGLAHLSRSELMYGMRDFVPLLGQCRFNNCTHRDEPGCAISAAAASGQIDERRVALYRRLFDENHD